MARLGTLYLPPSLPPSLPLVGLAGVERATERLADGWTGGDGERGLASLAAALSIGVIGKSRGCLPCPLSFMSLANNVSSSKTPCINSTSQL